MLVRYIMQETLSIIKKFGMLSTVFLSFFYLITIGLLNSNQILTKSIVNLAQGSNFEIFFDPDIGVDEVQFIANQVHSYPEIKSLQIRRPEEFMNSPTASLDSISGLSDLLKDLSPSIRIESSLGNSAQVESFLSELKQLNYVDEVLHNAEGQTNLLALATILNHASMMLLVFALVIAGILSLILTKLMTSFKKTDTQVLQSLGAPSLFTAAPMILFLLIIQPLAFFIAFMGYKFFSYHVSSLVQEVEWLDTLFESTTALSAQEFALLWLIAFIIFISIGTLKILVSTRQSQTIMLLLVTSFFSVSTFAKSDFSMSNLRIKQQAIESELYLIESHLKEIQSKVTLLKSENTTLKKTISELAHQYRKSQAKLGYIWKSDSQKWQDLAYQAKSSSNLITLIKRYHKQLKKNRHQLFALKKSLKQRQARLAKVHSGLAAALNLKKAEYEHYRIKLQSQIRELASSFRQFNFFNNKNMRQQPIVSPVYGKVVYTTKDSHLDNIIIIEHSDSTHLILSLIESNELKSGQIIEPGDFIAMNQKTNPKLQVRIFNQVISTHQLLDKGT